jgi:crotonobetainyl-CoA:carnitine CoA-transferase CaiB-like acyl-CoA transferase
MVVDLEHPEAGPTPQLGTPFRLREHPASVRTPAPPLGGSTRSVLERLGYGAQDIDALLAEGVAADAAVADTSR